MHILFAGLDSWCKDNFSCLSKYLRTMHILFVALERPRESRLEHNCFKCVAFERDAKCQGTISVAFVKKFWKRCISWWACSSHHQIFFWFSICQTHAKHGKMRALAASHETCKMAKTRTKKGQNEKLSVAMYYIPHICHQYHQYICREICHVEIFQISKCDRYGEIWSFSTYGEISNFSTSQMWTNLKFLHLLHVCDVENVST